VTADAPGQATTTATAEGLPASGSRAAPIALFKTPFVSSKDTLPDLQIALDQRERTGIMAGGAEPPASTC
jgi:hypothetical protein